MRKIAYFPTERAAQYVATMAKHFGKKISAELTGETLLLKFDAGMGQLVAQADGVSVCVETSNAEDATLLTDVIERHLLRFAHRECPTSLTWAIA